MSAPAKATHAGFTVLEMMAVVLLTAAVLIASINMYLQLARSSAHAADLTRTQRRTVLVLDRLARDLEGSRLHVRPDDVDPLSWPWLFLAEARHGVSGADHLKLDARRFAAPALPGEDAAGDLGVVAWWTVPRDDEGFLLLRWRHPALPESLDRAFPRPDDPGVQVVADDVARFGVRLLDEEGSWHERWDSSTLAHSNQLPVAAEIALALLPAAGEEAPVRTHRVRLPVRPVDLAALAEAGRSEEEGEEEDEENAGCVTVAECRQRNPEVFELFLSSRPDRAAAEQVLESLAGQCFADHAASLGLAVEDCP